MKEYIFNEKRTIESIIENKAVNEVNITQTIKKLARYNYYVSGLSQDASYDMIVNYMKENSPDFTEVGYYKVVMGCIKDASKGAWKNIDKVVITKEELERIQALDDIRKEKLAFVLLADAKYDNACKNSQLNLSYLSLSDLYRLARVTMPVKERSMFLHFLYADGLVEMNLNPLSTNKKLTYISENDDDVGLVLTENNYKELAFTYMNWKKGGYKECKSCGRLFKTKTNAQYCKKCSPKYQPVETKTIVCIDCGEEVIISAKNNKSCRCIYCQKEADKKSKKEWWKNNKLSFND